MPKTVLFLGSSTAAKSQAKALAKKLGSSTLEFLPWWEAFLPGRTLLEDLDSIKDKVDGAVLVFSPESRTVIRKNDVAIPNLNVLLEFGFFYGSLGREKVAIVKYGEYYLPSDLGGYVHVFGSTFFKRGAVVQVGKRTEEEFGRWVAAL